MQKTLLVVYHSQSGNTRQLVSALAEGAALEPQVQLQSVPALEAGVADLRAADGVVFASPENLGYMSGALKDFFDRTYYPAQPLQLGLPYALVISAGNDGRGAVREIDRILRGYPMKPVTEPIIVRGEVDEAARERCRELGQAMAAGIDMGMF